METIKIAEGTRLNVDGKTYDFLGNGFPECCDAINIPEEYRNDLFRALFAFGELDLSCAYAGHNVKIELIPVKD